MSFSIENDHDVLGASTLQMTEFLDAASKVEAQDRMFRRRERVPTRTDAPPPLLAPRLLPRTSAFAECSCL